jgi:CcmD family protein
MCNAYLVAAYVIFWGIFMVYSWMMQRRQQVLEKEVEEIKKALGQP